LEEYDVKNVMDYEPLPGWETGICGPITGFDKEGGPGMCIKFYDLKMF